MKLFFNVLFAWGAIILTVLLSIIWLIRVLKNKNNLTSINKYLRKNHIKFGYICLAMSFAHGMLSSFSIFSFNYGTIVFLMGILIWFTFKYKNSLGKKWIKYHRQLTVVFLIGTILHIVEVNGFVGPQRIIHSLKTDFETILNLPDDESTSAKYKDGTYYGEGLGYKPGLKVKVEINKGIIESIEILEHNEVGRKFYEPALVSIPQEILDNQSTEVDAIAGSTRTSNGIIDAVKDALSKAKL